MENNREITLIVTYRCRNGMREKFLEEGFISYDYYLSADDPDKLLVEKWSSEKRQKAHLETEHMGELKKIKEKYVTGTQVERF
ncbi:putative quinol monooxygenase [Ruminococcus sp.]|uniref:ABM domain-containing protein n=1 Tax=uncultured organism TaxID=155900 RepID=D9ZEP2_9ZZZZ|nr:antibiotic biosynthesis monooxygenase family protein [uncultured Ruminococcus sp.]ADD61796.1 putative protein [uncultured organism]